ncbi:MAG: RAMP superfamily CRISPR-associated protein [Candidatus Hodarchaeales archaeon]
MAKSVSKKNLAGTVGPIDQMLNDFTVNSTRKILKVRAYTPIAKPLNGSLPSSKTSHLLKLWSFDYEYKNGKETKTSSATAYMIKGLRGSLRHQVMECCKKHGLEVCHTSDKKTDQNGNSLLPKGFHLQGTCSPEKECLVHAVFGSKQHKSKIRVSTKPIANVSHKSFQTKTQFQNVHISTENRVVLTFDDRSIQDFGERYFSGEFEFEIDVTECTPTELGMLIEATMSMKKLGRGYNAGYGELTILKMHLVEVNSVLTPKLEENNDFTIEKHDIEKAIPAEFIEGLKAWQTYLENDST